MINAGCTCLGDARGNADEGQKMKTRNFIKKLINLIRKEMSYNIYIKVTNYNDRHVFIYIVFYEHIKKYCIKINK